MHNQPLVSVIVPIYNVEKYLRRCIDSIIKQTYKTLEIILVNDGSTDKCGKICDAYKSSDARVHVIHKENGGLSDARNHGMDIAKGDYILFIDSDDWIKKDCIQKLIYHAIQKNADVVISKYISVSSEDAVIQNKACRSSALSLSKVTALSCLLYQKKFTTSACGKLYKASIMKKERFPVGKLFEDVVTIFKVIESSEQIVLIDDVLYYYFERNDSITKSSFDIRKMDYVDACTFLYEYVCNYYPQLEKAAVSRLVWAEIYVIVHMDNYEKYNDIYMRVWKHVKRNRLVIIKDTNANIKCKCICLLTYLGSKNLKEIYNQILLRKSRFS